MNLPHTLLATLTAAMLLATTAARAQSVNLDLSTPATVNGSQDKVNYTTDNGVTIKYIKSGNQQGAYIYRNDTRYGENTLTISATKKIVKLALKGEPSTTKNKTYDLTVNIGTLTDNTDNTFLWTGATKSLCISGASVTTEYIITDIQVWLEGDATVTPGETGGDGGNTTEGPNLDDGKTYEQHYVLAKTLPTDGKPVTMAFVTHSKFRQTLAPYMEWKTQQGYHVEELYADEIATDTQTSGPELAEAIRQQLMSLPQRPAFVLIAGDIEEVPSFKGTQYYRQGNYYTDYYYGEYNGDFNADAYVGRFSANDVSQLQAQMDKTRHMAMLRSEEGAWLKQSVLAASPASDINIQKETDLLKDYPKQFPGNSVVETSAEATSTINNAINSGSSIVSYTGHAGVRGWGMSESYNTYQVSLLQNKDRYPVVFANTCHSGTFASTCLGEAFMQKKDAGAVVYVGATRESWDCGYFYTGGNKYSQTYEHLGLMRSLFPTSNQDKSQQARTIGEAVVMGNFGMLGGNLSNYYKECVEYMEILGDPTYQPYITTPRLMTIAAEKTTTQGATLTVETAPEAVACISRGREIIAVGLADKNGQASLTIPAEAATGEAVLYCSAPGYNDDFTSISIERGAESKKDIDAVPQKSPKADVTDIIALGKGITATYDNWPNDYIDATPSGATYLSIASADKQEKAFVLRNNYNYCSIVTQGSGGSLCSVKVDWQCETGEACVLGIYGSSSPFYMTSQAWDGTPGTLLGTIKRGDESTLFVEGNYPYLCIRVEEFADFPQAVLSAEIAQLEIGWNKGQARPEGDVTGDKLLKTDDVRKMERMLLHKEEITAESDLDNNGRISIGDITKLIEKLK